MFYLMQIVFILGGVLAITAVISGLLLIVCCMFGFIDNDLFDFEDEPNRKKSLIALCLVFVISFSGAVFLPSKSTIIKYQTLNYLEKHNIAVTADNFEKYYDLFTVMNNPDDE